MINFCSRKGVFCTSATDFGSCCATACMKKPDYVEVLSLGDVKIIGSDGREYFPIVRCKDCKYCYAEGFVNVRNVCEKHYDFGNVDDNFFCADGERTHG